MPKGAKKLLTSFFKELNKPKKIAKKIYLKVSKSGSKWLQMAPNGCKRLQMAINGSKWLQKC